MATAPVNPEHGSELPTAEAAEAVHGHETAAGATEAAHGGEGGGLPQFEFEYWGGQIVWLLLIFALLYVLFSRVFVPRLRRAMDVRAETIAGAVAEARRVQAEAEAQAQAARAELAEARAAMQRTAAEAKAKAQAEAAARQAEEDARLGRRLAEAEERIRASRDQAMGSVRSIALETAQAIAEKLTGSSGGPGEIEGALDALAMEPAR
jgi:F-type H+-transporting ATPase subunit b